MPANCQTVLYRTTRTDATQRLHLSKGCASHAGQANNVMSHPIEAFPPVWREWCDVCGPRS
jgi:hypothetical protein